MKCKHTYAHSIWVNSGVINLACDEGGANLALHMSVRFNENVVVLNSLIDNNWQQEERHEIPFSPGEKFDLHINAMSDMFEVWR